MSSISSFTLFPHLPSDLRLLIWEISAGSDSPSDRIRLLRVCSESHASIASVLYETIVFDASVRASYSRVSSFVLLFILVPNKAASQPTLTKLALYLRPSYFHAVTDACISIPSSHLIVQPFLMNLPNLVYLSLRGQQHSISSPLRYTAYRSVTHLEVVSRVDALPSERVTLDLVQQFRSLTHLILHSSRYPDSGWDLEKWNKELQPSLRLFVIVTSIWSLSTLENYIQGIPSLRRKTVALPDHSESDSTRWLSHYSLWEQGEDILVKRYLEDEMDGVDVPLSSPLGKCVDLLQLDE
ncbi:hypothetical protein DL96DRAFT_1619172 [Flagelloscypha sp. PMI_526]|nr:hypothetical protein DL96DRAFT_1619172 [Flagelloscypha sp. PMI_526]